MSFEGEIGEIDLIERLVEMGSEQFTGAIRFESDGIIKIVYFKGGDILSASTNDRTDAIDEILQRANKVTREHIKQALAKRKESETLGDALLGLGFITRKELTWARRVQVIGIIRSIVAWREGSYTIVADYLPKREEGTLFSLAQIIVELIVTDSDRSKSEQAMDSGNAVFEKAPAFDDSFRRLGLNEDAEQIVAQVDGTKTASEVASLSGKEIFNVYKLLEALRVLKLIQRSSKLPVLHEVSPSAATGWEVENPDFTLDDEPSQAAVEHEQWAPSPETATLEIPALTMPAWDAVETPSSIATPSVWDEPADAYEAPSTPVPNLPQTARPEEPQWGFDEAQIEAARRAAVPVSTRERVAAPARPPEPARKPAVRGGVWIVVALLLLLGAAAYPAWRWWEARTTPAVVPIVASRHVRLRNGPPPAASTTASPVSPAVPTSSGLRDSPAVRTTTVQTSSMAVPIKRPVVLSTAPSSRTAPIVTASPAAKVPSTKQPVTTGSAGGTRSSSSTSAVVPHLERTPAGAVTITNAPSPGHAVPDTARAKYDAMAKNFATQKAGNYTIQFELVCETASIARALNVDRERVWFAPIAFRGRSCYRVFWGHFETSAEASAAAKQMPAALGSTPVVVRTPRS